MEATLIVAGALLLFAGFMTGWSVREIKMHRFLDDIDSDSPLLCEKGRHRWGEWRGVTWEVYHFDKVTLQTAKYPLIGQVRACQRCGLQEEREVKL